MWNLLLALMASLLAAVFLQRKSLGLHASPFVFADLVACVFGATVFAVFEILSRRPYLALFLTVSCLLLLCVLNRAKRQALRDESLVFSDVALLGQLIRFPALYLPFLPCKVLLFALLGFLPACLALFLVSPVYEAKGFCLLLLAPFPLLYLATKSFLADALRGFLRRQNLAFSAEDAKRFGPLGACLLHLGWHLLLRGREGRGICGPCTVPYATPVCKQEMALLQEVSSSRLPDLFLIQEESFCDPRRFLPHLPQELLTNYDRLCGEGAAFDLAVHAYGAYTMRTEYEVLTAITPENLGSCVFHPYFTVAGEPSWSCVRFFKSLGYRTVCVHPFARDFFYRRRALPNLGFDQFIALDNFPKPQTFGPYVSDLSVAKCLLDLQKTSLEPLFCFAITMENHGPWGAGRFDQAFLQETLPGLDSDIERYLVHLRHADAMFGFLAEALKKSGKNAVLGVYGDHLPGLPELVPSTATDTPCFLWSTKPSCVAQQRRRERLTPSQFTARYLRLAWDSAK